MAFSRRNQLIEVALDSRGELILFKAEQARERCKRLRDIERTHVSHVTLHKGSIGLRQQAVVRKIRHQSHMAVVLQHLDVDGEVTAKLDRTFGT